MRFTTCGASEATYWLCKKMGPGPGLLTAMRVLWHNGAKGLMILRLVVARHIGRPQPIASRWAGALSVWNLAEEGADELLARP